MRYLDRVLIGLIFILSAFLALWYGSPQRLGALEPDPVYTWIFLLLFALGFIIASMGLLGAEDDYPALLSGFVLYFILGALVAAFLYVNGSGVGSWTIDQAAQPGFWRHWAGVAAMWPLQLVEQVGILGYASM